MEQNARAVLSELIRYYYFLQFDKSSMKHFVCLHVCLIVHLYPVHVKTTILIRLNFVMTTNMTQGKVSKVKGT